MKRVIKKGERKQRRVEAKAPTEIVNNTKLRLHFSFRHCAHFYKVEELGEATAENGPSFPSISREMKEAKKVALMRWQEE